MKFSFSVIKQNIAPKGNPGGYPRFSFIQGQGSKI
jgi:hypothetical protein